MAGDAAERRRQRPAVPSRPHRPRLTGREEASPYDEARAAALEDRLQAAQRLESIGVLAGAFAHDFNNHLTSILGFAELAQEQSAPQSQMGRFLEEIHRATQRAADLVRHMLAMADRRPATMRPLDLVAVVEDALRMLTTQIHAREAVLRYVSPPALPSIRGDATRLRQVILNLVLNALQALEDERRHLEVRLSERRVTAAEIASFRAPTDLTPGRYVVLSVSDSGCGMDTSALERAFDPFFTTKHAGHGLGLAAVLSAVRQHGAGLLMESAPEVGTRVQILFRPCGPPHAHVPTPALDPLTTGSGCLLVVDDERDVRHTAMAVLAAHGYDVLTADCGEEALALLREQPGRIHGVVLDMTMPGLGGRRTFHAMHRLDETLPVVVTTGFGEAGMTGSFETARPAGFLEKPYRTRDLLAAVDAALHPDRVL